MRKEDKFKYYKWSWGDRYDGWRVRKVDPVFSVIPYFLRTVTRSPPGFLGEDP